MSTTIEKMLQESALSGKQLLTPLYIVNKPILEENIDQLYAAFRSRFDKFIFGYSYKTNPAGGVLDIVHRKGAYAEVVSPMELRFALRNVPKSRIIYNGVIQDPYSKFALATEGAMVNVENMTELRDMARLACERGVTAEVGIRVNLQLTDSSFSRFGIEVTPEAVKEIVQLPNIKVIGIHCHITKSRGIRFWWEKAHRMSAIAKELGVRYIDFGGNMYGPMNPKLAAQFDGDIPTFQDYADCLYDEMSHFFSQQDMPTVIVECGTPIISNAQSLLTTVVDIKTICGKTVCTLDAKKLDITVIGDSGKQFPYHVITHGGGRVTDASMYGCTCLEFDRLVDSYTGPLSIGDQVLFDNIGSYSNVLSPRFIQDTPQMCVYDPDSPPTVCKFQSTIYDKYL